MNNNTLEKFVLDVFGVDLNLFFDALKINASARGYIHGAIGELLLAKYLENKGFEVIRIKEKPSGGFRAKSEEARGDYYIRKKNIKKEDWFVVECKGLKTNAEFRGAVLDKKKLFRYLLPLIQPKELYHTNTYKSGLKIYSRAKEKWQRKYPEKKFPPFRWSKDTPGPVACNLLGLWKDPYDLKKWIESQPNDYFTEEAYRKREGVIAILQTHKPNTREAPITGISQAAPLVTEFSILAVDLFLRAGKHIFAFMNPMKISHSPSSPEHLYQNYTIDILIKEKKQNLNIVPPWYLDINECINQTNPEPRRLDNSQIDNR